MMSAPTTLHPCLLNSVTHALPMPDAAPVTSTDGFRNISYSFGIHSGLGCRSTAIRLKIRSPTETAIHLSGNTTLG